MAKEIIQSNTIERLKALYANVNAAELGKKFSDAQNTQDSLVYIIADLGLTLLALKENAPHGKFQKLVEDCLKKHCKGNARNFRSAQAYMQFARGLLAYAENPREGSNFGDRILAYARNMDIKENPQILPFAFSDAHTRSEFLEFVCRGFTYSQMSSLFKALHLAENEKENELSGNPNPPTELPDDKSEAKKVQLDFFRELDKPILKIDEMIKSPTLAHMPKDKVLDYANALIERGHALKFAVTGKHID